MFFIFHILISLFLLTLKVRRVTKEGMRLCSFSLDVAPLTGQIIKNRLNVYERGENLLQNSIIHLSEIDLQS